MGCLIIPFIAALLCCFCKSQDADDITLILRTIVDGQYQTREQLAEQGKKIETLMEEQERRTQTLMEEQEMKIQTLMEEHQKITSSLEQCSSRDQLNDFRDLLATDECFEGSHNCSELASCTNEMINYQCSCLPGYSGDGFICQDIDECISGNNTCGVKETCINQPGSYNCICEVGFKKEGNTCQDIDECISGNYTCGVNEICINQPGTYRCNNCEEGFKKEGNTCQGLCESPSKSIVGLGCVIPVKVLMNGESAQNNCKANGTRLLEGIGKEHFTLLRDHFFFLGTTNIYIGIRDWQWVTSKEPVAQELWREGQPDRGIDHCGGFYAHSSTPGLHDLTCATNRYSFCQSIY